MTYNDETLKQAVKGTSDYHTLMTAIVTESLMKQAGYIAPKTGAIEKTYANPEHWQSRKLHMNAGMLWIFFATENGHFSTGEAILIWRYGQALKFPEIFRAKNPQISTNQVLMDAIEHCIKNPRKFTDGFGDICFSADDEFNLREIREGIFQQPYEIYPNQDGGIDVQRKKYREIVRLIDNLILWVYTGQDYLTDKDKKELYQYMMWSKYKD